jgi:hypothetical protein
MRAMSYLVSMKLKAWLMRPTMSAEMVPDEPEPGSRRGIAVQVEVETARWVEPLDHRTQES